MRLWSSQAIWIYFKVALAIWRKPPSPIPTRLLLFPHLGMETTSPRMRKIAGQGDGKPTAEWAQNGDNRYLYLDVTFLLKAVQNKATCGLDCGLGFLIQ